MKASKMISTTILLVTGMLIAILSGCGGGGSSSSSNGSGSTQTTNPPSSSNPPPDPPVVDTVQGVDSNDNGVRDDVETALHERHPDLAQPMMNALMQEAKSLQMAVMAGVDMDADMIDRAVEAIDMSIACTNELFGDAGYDETVFIEYTTVNTPTRSEAYIRFNEALDGQFFSADQENPCEQQSGGRQ